MDSKNILQFQRYPFAILLTKIKNLNPFTSKHLSMKLMQTNIYLPQLLLERIKMKFTLL